MIKFFRWSQYQISALSICILIQIIQVKNKHHLNLDKNWMPRNVKEKKRKWQKLWSLHREEWPGEIIVSELHAFVDWAY